MLKETAKMSADENIEENVNPCSNAGGPTDGECDDSSDHLLEYDRHRTAKSDGGRTCDDDKHGLSGECHPDANENGATNSHGNHNHNGGPHPTSP
ncbi:hypothetical protein ACQY0O_007501 [Thecaphora frezii]